MYAWSDLMYFECSLIPVVYDQYKCLLQTKIFSRIRAINFWTDSRVPKTFVEHEIYTKTISEVCSNNVGNL